MLELNEFVLCSLIDFVIYNAFEAYLLDLTGLIPSEMDKLEIQKK